MIFVSLFEAAERGELLLIHDGLCRFHLRKDGVVVIREILVLPFVRGVGIGKRLLSMVRERHPTAKLLAKCPASYEANGFWRAMGFRLESQSHGINQWVYPDDTR